MIIFFIEKLANEDKNTTHKESNEWDIHGYFRIHTELSIIT